MGRKDSPTITARFGGGSMSTYTLIYGTHSQFDVSTYGHMQSDILTPYITDDHIDGHHMPLPR